MTKSDFVTSLPTLLPKTMYTFHIHEFILHEY